MPTAKVDVQQMTDSSPCKKDRSIALRSTASKPAWWKATPHGRTPCNTRFNAQICRGGACQDLLVAGTDVHHSASMVAVDSQDFRVKQNTKTGFPFACLERSMGSFFS